MSAKKKQKIKNLYCFWDIDLQIEQEIKCLLEIDHDMLIEYVERLNDEVYLELLQESFDLKMDFVTLLKDNCLEKNLIDDLYIFLSEDTFYWDSQWDEKMESLNSDFLPRLNEDNVLWYVKSDKEKYITSITNMEKFLMHILPPKGDQFDLYLYSYGVAQLDIIRGETYMLYPEKFIKEQINKEVNRMSLELVQEELLEKGVNANIVTTSSNYDKRTLLQSLAWESFQKSVGSLVKGVL
ncbi:MAG: hypothetical protein ACOCQR_03110 [bacterium]